VNELTLCLNTETELVCESPSYAGLGAFQPEKRKKQAERRRGERRKAGMGRKKEI
jgi:hypothetical protein